VTVGIAAGGGRRYVGEAENELVERAAGQRCVRAKRRRVATHEAARRDQLDLGVRPRALRLREHDGRRGQSKARADECGNETAHESRIGRALARL
jgi:hypothetical protein